MHYFPLKLGYFLKSEINELYITNALRSFALSTIAIFLPIFFLKKGYSLYEVLLYFLVIVIIAPFFCESALRFSSKKGVKHSIALSTPLLIVFFIGLYNIDYLINFFGRISTLVFLSIFSSISTSFYFMGFHIDFARFSEVKQSARQISIIQALGIIFSIIGPLFGALVISFYSFNVLFVIVMITLLFSVMPLFFSKEVHEPFEVKIRNIFSKEEIKRSWVFFAEGVSDYAARIFWPLLLYFLMINLNQIGGLFTLSNALLALFTIYVGKKIHSHNKKKILRIGAIIRSLTLVIRTLLKTVSTIAIVQGFGGISLALVSIPFQSTFYNNSKKIGIAHTIFSREVYLHLGRFCLILLLALLLLFTKAIVALIVAIIVGALFTLFMIKIREE
ncbi:MAG: hypothetical protein ISS25_03030 [Nanoarchaeota archaeon]|nr:hypothetical protein [Nanoarchaeota archaeon]